jgi:putative nucleotidyltransferase with HDIG domain
VSWRHDAAFWAQLTHRQQLEAAVVAREPGDVPMAATDDRLDKIAYAFAAVIDAKTPFTYKHSSNVAKYAVGIATAVGADDAMLRHVLRAGLLHDVGKLGISNRILDKPAPLTEAERIEIMKHPEYTWQILERVSAFRPFARSASLHHERLDGSGYPWKLSGEALDFTARTIAIADVYEALTAERPYRSAMPVHDVLLIMRRDGDRAFDGTLLDAAAALAEGGVFAQLAADGDDAITQLRAHALTPLIPRAAIAA